MLPRVNFIIVLRAAFAHEQIPNAQKDWLLHCLFLLWGSAHAKAALRTLVKLTPDPESAKREPSCQSFCAFGIYICKKLLVECWWNRTLRKQKIIHLVRVNGTGICFWLTVKKWSKRKYWACNIFVTINEIIPLKSMFWGYNPKIRFWSSFAIVFDRFCKRLLPNLIKLLCDYYFIKRLKVLRNLNIRLI